MSLLLRIEGSASSQTSTFLVVCGQLVCLAVYLDPIGSSALVDADCAGCLAYIVGFQVYTEKYLLFPHLLIFRYSPEVFQCLVLHTGGL